jgi:hypothetical protein
MNTIKDFKPPVTESGPQCAGEYSAVEVRIMIPDGAVSAPLFPSGNRCATRILSRLLRTRIEAAGIAVNSSDYAFPLNSSWCRFRVVQRPAAPTLAIVRDELAALGLLAFAQVGWRDQNDGTLRLYYPKSGEFMATPKEELEADLRLVLEAEEANKRGIIVYGAACN